MIAEQIKDVKKFMTLLLIKDTFDEFLINEATITTYNTFHIDGHINRDFFNEDEFDELKDQHLSYWSKIKPICYSLIKGNKTPLYFKIIFALNREQIKSIVEQNNISINENDINELFFNIKYESGMLTITTGCSLKIFTMDKSLENAFDKYISLFISTLF